MNNAELFKKKHPEHEIFIITDKSELSSSYVQKIKPQLIFFPHWSWIIPDEIYSNFKCIVFHMTDLPYGRGGSPLQNLIVRGKTKTKISAIKVEGSIDAGPIYLKKNLDLRGSANEILQRASDIIFSEMMPAMMTKTIRPIKQSGKVTIFARRRPDQGSIGDIDNIKAVHDHIRMLDGEGYPRAFLDHKKLDLKFHNSNLENNTVTATVEIRIKPL
jgi:methionyl-tRNA formyltransferase